MKIPAKAKSIIQSILAGGVASTIFNLFMGRCTTAAIIFSIIGIYGWFKGHDIAAFATFIGSIQALLVLHSWKEDVHERKMAELELRKGQADGKDSSGQN
jgi:hypothetical protein